jgi:hypothetical protein
MGSECGHFLRAGMEPGCMNGPCVYLVQGNTDFFWKQKLYGAAGHARPRPRHTLSADLLYSGPSQLRHRYRSVIPVLTSIGGGLCLV